MKISEPSAVERLRVGQAYHGVVLRRCQIINEYSPEVTLWRILATTTFVYQEVRLLASLSITECGWVSLSERGNTTAHESSIGSGCVQFPPANMRAGRHHSRYFIRVDYNRTKSYLTASVRVSVRRTQCFQDSHDCHRIGEQQRASFTWVLFCQLPDSCFLSCWRPH